MASSPRKFFYLTLVRHGQTDSNKSQIIQGHMDTLLSETGRNQVSQLSSYLSKLGIHFDLVFSSDLTRALETAEIILNQDNSRQEQRSANGHSTSSSVLSQVASSQSSKSSNEKQEFTDSGHCSGTESDTGTSSSSPSPSNFASIVSLSSSSSNFPSQPLPVRIRVDSRLRERSYGILEGKTLKDLREAARAAGFNEKNYSFLTPEGAESLEQVRQRIADFCNQLISQVTSCNTHSGINNNNEPSHNPQSSNAKESSNNTATNDTMSSKVTSTTPSAMVKCNDQGNNITANGLGYCNGKPVSVLVTTHGGVIREFMRYFRDQYKCLLVPLHEPLQVTPNTGVNIFKVYYEFSKKIQHHSICKVDLLVYHDITHLQEPSEKVTSEQQLQLSSGPRDVSILIDLFRERQSRTISSTTPSPVKTTAAATTNETAVDEQNVAPQASSAQFEAL